MNVKNISGSLPIKEFYNSRKVPLTSIPTVEDTWFNSGADTFVIEVSGATTFGATVKGCVNYRDANNEKLPVADRPFSALKVINMSTMQTADTITTNGIYAVSVTGISNILIDIETLTGSVTIVGSCGHWED